MKAYLFPLLFLVACEPLSMEKADTRLKITNNHDNKIIFLTSRDYPDTVNFTFNSCSAGDIASYVDAGGSKPYAIYQSWENYLNAIPSKTMMLFVFDVDTFNMLYHKAQTDDTFSNSDCDSVKSSGKWLKRYDINMKFLERNKWNVTYP